MAPPATAARRCRSSDVDINCEIDRQLSIGAHPIPPNGLAKPRVQSIEDSGMSVHVAPGSNTHCRQLTRTAGSVSVTGCMLKKPSHTSAARSVATALQQRSAIRVTSAVRSCFHVEHFVLRAEA